MFSILIYVNHQYHIHCTPDFYLVWPIKKAKLEQSGECKVLGLCLSFAGYWLQYKLCFFFYSYEITFLFVYDRFMKLK